MSRSRPDLKGTIKGLPHVVSREEWLVARKALLVQEKALTRQRDALSAERRRLPIVRVEKDCAFEGPDGPASLLDLFEGRRQLVVGHFMFDPSWNEGCPSCTSEADEVSSGLIAHLHTRHTSFAYVSRAPLAKLEAHRVRKGWTFPWYSSYGSDFNYDFHVTLDESVAPMMYNYRTQADHDQAGTPSCPSRHLAGVAFYAMATRRSTPTRCTRATSRRSGSYYRLDETALDRQEMWEEPKGRVADAPGAIPDLCS